MLHMKPQTHRQKIQTAKNTNRQNATEEPPWNRQQETHLCRVDSSTLTLWTGSFPI